jgi:uncharacterized protein (TIGR02246 family)
MLSRTLARAIAILAFLIVVGAIQVRAQVASNPAKEADRLQQSEAEAEKAIRVIDANFVRDYNNGDSKALANYFTEDAEVQEAEGDRYLGRSAIEQLFAETFEASKGARIVVEIESIRLLSPDVAKEEGRSVVTPKSGAPVPRRYTVLYVKRDGRWLVSSDREEYDPQVKPHDHLKALEWLVGDWLDEGNDAVVRVNCKWSDDENYLIRTFTVHHQGKPVMTVTQRIGWDPQARQIRSWEFDSEGGFGEGRWAHKGDRWVIKHSGVRPDGVAASATNILSSDRLDRIRWTSTDRVIANEAEPDDHSFVLIRVPPSLRTGPKGNEPASHTERSRE